MTIDPPRVAHISVDNALVHVAINAACAGHTLEYTIVRNTRDDSAVMCTCRCGLHVHVYTLTENAHLYDVPDYKVDVSDNALGVTDHGTRYLLHCKDVQSNS